MLKRRDIERVERKIAFNQEAIAKMEVSKDEYYSLMLKKKEEFEIESKKMERTLENIISNLQREREAKNRLEDEYAKLCIKYGIDCSPCIFCANYFHQSQLKEIEGYDFSYLPKDTNPKFLRGCGKCVEEFLIDNMPKRMIGADETVCVELLPSCTNCGIKICREGGCERVICTKCNFENYIFVEWKSHKKGEWLILIILKALFNLFGGREYNDERAEVASNLLLIVSGLLAILIISLSYVLSLSLFEIDGSYFFITSGLLRGLFLGSSFSLSSRVIIHLRDGTRMQPFDKHLLIYLSLFLAIIIVDYAGRIYSYPSSYPSSTVNLCPKRKHESFRIAYTKA
jgi:hypothetical protein